ncbi:uncharacterized protein [Eurosta solidaginis]|uniref:uncharacterized protein isoform X1 n=2 Tax=Eurosta solidaginis TaxID=178769 RepID=UPI00353175C7
MLQAIGIVKSKISDKGNAEEKFGIPTGPNVNTNCAHCGDKHHMGGPLWSHPIHDPTFVEELLQIIEEKPLSDLDTTSFKRKATTPAKEPVSCQRFSLDLEEDLQTLLEARAAPHVANVDQHESNVAVSGNAMNKLFEMEDENKSNNANTIKRIPYNFSTKASCDETIFECQQQRTSDESFMALEKMCDKTASDPNSTLFKYIHSENKDMVKEDAKKRSADGNYFKIPCKQELQEIDEEAQSLQRLLHDLCVQEQHQLDNETPLKSIDVTLLENIEAPSKMWDSTIVGDTTLQTSPLKMVRLLRPSTILEENCEDQSNSSLGGDDASSHISFQSAQKGSETSATTSF